MPWGRPDAPTVSMLSASAPSTCGRFGILDKRLVRSINIKALLSRTSKGFLGLCGEFDCSRWSVETNSSGLNQAMLIPDEFHVLSAEKVFLRSNSITVSWQSWKLMEKHILRSVFSAMIPWVRRIDIKRMISHATSAESISQEVNFV